MINKCSFLHVIMLHVLFSTQGTTGSLKRCNIDRKFGIVIFLTVTKELQRDRIAVDQFIRRTQANRSEALWSTQAGYQAVSKQQSKL